MKKMLAMLLLAIAVSAVACETYTIVVDGKILNCTRCGNDVFCA